MLLWIQFFSILSVSLSLLSIPVIYLSDSVSVCLSVFISLSALFLFCTSPGLSSFFSCPEELRSLRIYLTILQSAAASPLNQNLRAPQRHGDLFNPSLLPEHWLLHGQDLLSFRNLWHRRQRAVPQSAELWHHHPRLQRPGQHRC